MERIGINIYARKEIDLALIYIMKSDACKEWTTKMRGQYTVLILNKLEKNLIVRIPATIVNR